MRNRASVLSAFCLAAACSPATPTPEDGVETGGAQASGAHANGGSPEAGSGGRSSGGSLTSNGGIPNAGGTGSGASSGGHEAGGAPLGGQVSGGTSAGGSSSSGGGGASSGGAATGGEASCPTTYNNPLIWEDLPDLEVIRVGDAYYYTASSFHHSPGAPILRSYDLVHWEYVSHSVPRLDFDASYDLSGSSSYVNGIWASTLRYRESNQTFYWMGCMHNKGGGWVFTAKSPEGPWEKHKGGCYYDMGLLIDDDDTMYVSSGNDTISVAQLSADGFSQVKSQTVYQTPSSVGGPLEGSRFYKKDGSYYILLTQYANGEYVLRSTSGPFGPYEMKPFAVKLPFAGAGAGASPHQGGIIETQNGDWYYLAFNDSYPAGRLPVMAPVTWTDGWPSVELVGGKWGASYPFPDLPCGAGRVSPSPAKDEFTQPTLRPEWEWNHNPDDTKWSAGTGLKLQTATVTSDIYKARNTLTRRIAGPISIGTIELNFAAMQDGDVAGLAAFRDTTAAIAVKKVGSQVQVVMRNGMTMNTNWTTTSTGSEVASAAVTGEKIWLRVEANVRTDAGGGQAKFYYSTDGSEFTALGNTLTMNKAWNYFLGYRFGIFNYATTALGGSVTVNSFALSQP